MSQSGPAIDGVLNNESGVVIENDNGRGISKWGITWLTAKLLQPDWTEDILRNLTRGQAGTFYYLHFWIPSNIGLLSDQALANKCLDLCVNLGQITAIKLLQQAAGVSPVDGVIGPATASAVNAVDPVAMLYGLRSYATEYYQGLVARNSALSADLDGWLTRLNRP